MIVEIISLFAILTGGVALMQTFGIRGWPLPFVGFIAGIAIYLIIGAIQVITGLTTSPILALTLTAVLPMGWWLWCKSRGQDLSIHLLPTFFSVIILVLLAVLLRQAELTSLTPDSFRYVMLGSLLNSGNLDAVGPDYLLTRLIAAPYMHAPANLACEFHLPAITPILALSTALTLAWFCQESLRNRLNSTWLVRVFALLGLGLLVTNNRFIFHTFYINAHMLNAAFLLFIVGGSWLLVRQSAVPQRALLLLIIIAIPALTVSRPEASIFAALALLPILFKWSIPWKYRANILAVLGFSIATWHGFLWLEYSRANLTVEISVVLMFVAGIAAILFSPLLARHWLEKLSPKIPAVTEIGLWLALALATLQDPGMLYRSTVHTIHNVLLDYGGWGVSLAVLGLLALMVLVLTNIPDRIFLRFPLTTFIPASMIIMYLRDVTYRVGYGDSLNRMLLNILPLAILLVVSSAASERWGLPDWLQNAWGKINASTAKKRFF